ncbi:MAG TPA: hypothetical protein VNR11_02310 [Xanthobacteraceae bacterium]|nr:hypothetical protein [Xanthobacteraceae bacterium]
MHSLIKTALFAAVGAAIVTAPAFAASKRADRIYPGGVYGYAPGAYAYAPGGYAPLLAPGPYLADPNSGQIVNEYLKDTPMHNGNAY